MLDLLLWAKRNDAKIFYDSFLGFSILTTQKLSGVALKSRIPINRLLIRFSRVNLIGYLTFD